MSTLRHDFIGFALKAIATSGLDRVAGKRFSGLGAILTFHHVRTVSDRLFPQNQLLEITPGYLETVIRTVRDLGYEIIRLDDVAARIAQEDHRPFVVLTFDDGYRDNRDYALPILTRLEAPFTLYVAAGFADRTAPLWWLDLEDAVRALDKVDVDLPGGRFVRPSATREEKIAAFRHLYWSLRSLREPEAQAAITALSKRTGVEQLERVERLCMDWNELRALAREPLVTIGAHTVTHPRLATLAEADAQIEISESKARLELELGLPVRHFSYPVGDPTSAGSREFALCKEAGFETGVTTRPGVLTSAHADHMHALPRISVNGLFQNADALRVLLSGLPFWLKNRGRMLNVA